MLASDSRILGYLEGERVRGLMEAGGHVGTAVGRARAFAEVVRIAFDPDKGLELRSEVQERLLQQQVAVAGGERGQAVDDVVHQLGLN
jgi:hypothetical protein